MRPGALCKNQDLTPDLAPDLIVRSRRAVLPTGIRPAAIHIHHGKIIGVLDFEDAPSGCPRDEAADAVVMPGVVDTHVHLSTPGRTESESVEVTTRAAAAGGVTTIVATPLDGKPLTTTADALERKRRAADGRCFVDVGFWGGVVPGNTLELPGLVAAGVLGFECSLMTVGASPDVAASATWDANDFGPVGEADLRLAMPLLAKHGSQLLVHAELPGPIDSATRLSSGRGWLSRILRTAPDPRSYATYLATRPKAAENEAIALVIGLCREYRVRAHILHLSSSDALTPIYHARASGLPMTAETCPHYLTFVADEIPDGATAFTCAPPIRERENREYLWAALAGGLLQMVVSDHWASPVLEVPRALDDFFRAPAGISSIQVSLAATWTAAAGRGYSLNQLTEWMCRAPARLAGLGRKGAIDVGYDADLVIWDPNGEFVVDSSPHSVLRAPTDSRIAGSSHPRARPIPYEGRRLRGVVERTYLRGARIYERGRPMGVPYGRLLSR